MCKHSKAMHTTYRAYHTCHTLLSLDYIEGHGARVPVCLRGAVEDAQGYDWLHQWYPVAVAADLDSKRPHSLELFGRWADAGVMRYTARYAASIEAKVAGALHRRTKLFCLCSLQAFGAVVQWQPVEHHERQLPTQTRTTVRGTFDCMASLCEESRYDTTSHFLSPTFQRTLCCCVGRGCRVALRAMAPYSAATMVREPVPCPHRQIKVRV